MKSLVTRTFLSLVLAVGTASSAVLITALPALAVTCTTHYLVGPYYESYPDNDVAGSVAVNCPTRGRGGDYAQFQIIKVSTGAVVASYTNNCTAAGCDYTYMIAGDQSGHCVNYTNTQYYARWRAYVDDKFGWEAWVNGVVKTLPCNV